MALNEAATRCECSVPLKAAQRGYNTNLASEFYVLAMLYRLGLDANLTLGNKKSVDITVVLGPGHAVTIDVKAVAAKMDWLIGNTPAEPKANHYVVLVSYEGGFSDPERVPRCWVLRHDELLPLMKTAGGTGRVRYLSRKQLLSLFGEREGASQLITGMSASKKPITNQTHQSAQ
jgi:hypothetical protein